MVLQYEEMHQVTYVELKFFKKEFRKWYLTKVSHLTIYSRIERIKLKFLSLKQWYIFRKISICFHWITTIIKRDGKTIIFFLQFKSLRTKVIWFFESKTAYFHPSQITCQRKLKLLIIKKVQQIILLSNFINLFILSI